MGCGVAAVRDVVACGVAAGRRSSRHGPRSSSDMQMRRFAGFMVPKRERDRPRTSAAKSAPALRGAMAPRGSQLSPSDLAAAIRAASQGSRVGDLRMWRDFAEQTLFHAGALTPKQMAFITNGFARATVPDRDVFRRLADRALECVGDFEPRDAALLLNAYAKLGFRDLVLFQEFAKSIRNDAPAGYGEQQMSLIANAFARLEIRDVTLFQTLSTWIVSKAHELTAQGVATVANAYAKVTISDAALLQAVIASVDQHLQSFGPQHLSNILNAYAKLQVSEPDAVERLVSQIPSRVHDFGPIDLAASVHAMSKLSVSHRQAWSALSAAVRDRGEEFRARQIAIALHSFSMLSVAYGGLLVDMSPHVLDNVDMADDQSLVLLFCGYARVGQPQGTVMRCLLDRLDSRIASLETQALVNLFYACGRLGLQKEPLVRHLAHELLPEVRSLSPQHVSNCLYAVSRLGLVHEEFSTLLEALQRRALRGDLAFEPQHLANMLHALFTVHGVSQGEEVARPVLLPGALVPSLVSRVLRCKSWTDEPQLLASIAISCSGLRQASAPLFMLVSETAQNAKVILSKPVIVDLIAAFGASQFFDIEFYSWALGQYTSGSRNAVPFALNLRLLHALHYANYVFAASEDLTRFPREKERKEQQDCMLFLDCPADFQQQVVGFYEDTGLGLLARAGSLPKSLLMEVSVPFAHAHLHSVMPPFDLLSASAQKEAALLADSAPNAPLLGGSAPAGDGEAWVARLPMASGEITQAVSNEDLVGGTLLDRLLVELRVPLEEPIDANRLVGRLARYATLLRQSSGSGGTGVEDGRSAVPANVLDPLLREMGDQLVANVPRLSFEELAAALETLGDAGICPRSVTQTLAEAAQECFPEKFDSFPEMAAVASLCRGLGASGVTLSPGLHARLRDFVEDLASLEGSRVQCRSLTLSGRPLRVVTTLLDTLQETLVLTSRAMNALLTIALRPVLEELQFVCSSSSAGLAHQRACLEFEDASGLLMVVTRLLASRSPGSSEQLLHDTAVVTGALLTQLLHKWHNEADVTGPRQDAAKLLELLQCLAGQSSSMQTLGVSNQSMPMEAWQLALLVAISDELNRNAQALGPPGLVLCLKTFAKMRLFVVLEAPGFADPDAASAALDSAMHRARTACGLPAEHVPREDGDDRPGGPDVLPRFRLPRLVISLLRAVMLHVRRLSPAEAACVADFCASALDAPSLTDAEKDEASAGLAQLLERLCWERQRWSQEDRRLVAGIGTLLRSEFPELLRSRGWVSRSVQAALEEVRRAGV